MGRKKAPVSSSSDLLLCTLAEQVKLPLITIAHAAELSKSKPDAKNLSQLYETISITTAATLRLIDGYLLSVQLQKEPRLPLEPVALGSVLYDTSQILNDYAKAHDCEINLRFNGKYGPVMARRDVVQSALISLGYSFIEANSKAGSKSNITIAVHRTNNGISAGVFSDNDGLSSSLFKQAKVLKGLVRQPMSDFSAGSGAGVFVADALFGHLETPMRVARYRSLHGLAATLIPSRQLSLV